eukprot:SAG31_NODE_831_length_11669_cov_3.410026_5_plen_299_part_00
MCSCLNKEDENHRVGGWEFNCSHAAWFGVKPTLPYGNSGLPVGTLSHYYHTLTAGVSVWNDTAPGTQLGILFRRMAEPSRTKITATEIFKYWEANIAGAPLFPSGIKMLIGSFKDLFGTPNGARLQAWCKKRGWVLVWALGEIQTNSGAGTTQCPPGPSGSFCDSSSYYNRTLDPTVIGSTSAAHNLSIPETAQPIFVQLWHEVAAALNRSAESGDGCCLMPPCKTGQPRCPPQQNPSEPQPPSVPNQVNETDWVRWWRHLETNAPSLSVGFLDGMSCSNANACVGVQSTSGACVCYS